MNLDSSIPVGLQGTPVGLQRIDDACQNNFQDIPLRFGFWPRTKLPVLTEADNLTRHVPQQRAPLYDCDLVSEDEAYIGTADGRPPPPFTVVKDIRKGFFVFVRPGEGCSEPIWLGKVMEHPQLNASLPNFKEFKVRWWTPNNANDSSVDAYLGWNTFPMFSYKLDRTAKTQDRISTDKVLASWKPKKGRFQVAPSTQIQFAEDNLSRIIEHERRPIQS